MEEAHSSLADILAHDQQEKGEHEWEVEVGGDERFVAVRHAWLSGVDGTARNVYILRDITEQKAFEKERAQLEQKRALIEVSEILAHEIRNPLGSMELFTGLLADATAHLPETRQWITHLQAGLRGLSATMTNVVDVYINYLRRKVDSGYERALIRTVRGVGYQIGGATPAARSAAAASSGSVTVV